jgi:mobilome CxxCx(11)CxxC protein
MTEEEIRGHSWDQAIQAQGTYEVFARRARHIRRWVRFRDFFGILVPVLVAALFTTEWTITYRGTAVAMLAVAGLVQFITIVWGLLAGWDEELAYSTRAMRDNYDLRVEWERIGKGEPGDLLSAYRVASDRQRSIDLFDVEKHFSSTERRRGLRAALIAFNRPCVCGRVPTSEAIPLLIWHRCGACGGPAGLTLGGRHHGGRSRAHTESSAKSHTSAAS